MTALVAALPAPSFLTILLVVAGVWLLPFTATLLWVWADRWLDNRYDSEPVVVDPHGDLIFQQMCVERWDHDLAGDER